jgi:hypothetical protein
VKIGSGHSELWSSDADLDLPVHFERVLGFGVCRLEIPKTFCLYMEVLSELITSQWPGPDIIKIRQISVRIALLCFS